MAIYAIGDLHLSFSAQKPMDVFPGWTDYTARLQRNWKNLVKPEDTVVVAGDVSWAMTLADALEDFRFIDALPGRKLLMKGNHDYWWSTRAKMDRFLQKNGLATLSILHNNSVRCEEVWLCGSRGWFFEEGVGGESPLVTAREAGRIRRSLEDADEGEKLLFLHYPPAYGTQVQEEFFDEMERFGVRECYYGHLHGALPPGALRREYRDVSLRLISADHLGFAPLRVR